MRRTLITLAIALFLATSGAGQDLPWYIDSVSVTPPGFGGVGAVQVSGVWLDTCAPDAISHSVTRNQGNQGNQVDLEIQQPGLNTGCGDFPTPWSLTEEFTVASNGNLSIFGTLVAVDPQDRGIRSLLSGPDLLFRSTGSPGAKLEGLGNPQFGYVSRALDVSANGRVVVGHNELAPGGAGFIIEQAMTWTASTGQVPLDFLPGGIPGESSALGVSADGRHVVGRSTSMNTLLGEGVRWSPDSAPLGLGTFSELSQTRAVATSRNGQVIAGTNRFFSVDQIPLPPFERAFRWTEDGGLVDLGSLIPEGDSSAADISRSGRVITGSTTSIPSATDPLIRPGLTQEPFLWTEADGMVGLGHLPYDLTDVPNAFMDTRANGISGDGKFVVGSSSLVSLDGLPDLFHRAFLWNDQTGMIDLGDLPVFGFSYEAVDVSLRGEIVVGNATFFDGFKVPFLWTAEDGMRLLEGELSDVGLTDLEGWTLGTVAAISDDGSAIVGTGINPDGEQEGWRVTFRRSRGPFTGTLGLADFGEAVRFEAYSVPEPQGLALVALLCLLTAIQFGVHRRAE